MEFKIPYLLAMREKAPKLFNSLSRSGKLDEHLRQKTKQAHEMFDDLTKKAPKLPNGLPKAQPRIEAERLVLETLIEFPDESPDPQDPLGRKPEDSPAIA